ncbi:MAG TPA: sulfite exporter TauE/SafE family protein [Acidobacteriota bacterium]|nr:sulfite exporter TauE/SafE family protein [Acidobacteriota bacterium]
MADWTSYSILFGGGLLAGALNVVAGGGSFLTLPLMIFLGMPADVANGTNRVGILLQNVGAVWGFHRYRVLPWSFLLLAGLPSMAGSALGAALALWISPESFKNILAILMVAVSLWTLWDPLSGLQKPEELSRNRRLWLVVAFFAAGLYGGFIQAGVGFLLLAATTLAGLDLVRGNAVKVLSVLLFTCVSLAIFVWQGKVLWLPGLSLAAGTALGGLAGVRLTVLKGHAWVRWVVTATILIFAFKLLWSY